MKKTQVDGVVTAYSDLLLECMICFGETAAIGFFLKSLLEDPDREALRKTLIFVPVIATVILGALLLGWKNGEYHFSRSALFFTALLLASYWIILLISRKESRRRFLPVMMLVEAVHSAACEGIIEIHRAAARYGKDIRDAAVRQLLRYVIRYTNHFQPPACPTYFSQRFSQTIVFPDCWMGSSSA